MRIRDWSADGGSSDLGIGVRRADGGAQVYRRVRGECVFDGLGIDVVAAADNQVLGAALQMQPAFGIHEAHVATDQPAVFREGAGGVGGVQKTGRSAERRGGESGCVRVDLGGCV